MMKRYVYLKKVEIPETNAKSLKTTYTYKCGIATSKSFSSIEKNGALCKKNVCLKNQIKN